MSLLDDRDAGAAFDRQECQFANEVADRARLGVGGLADAHLAARAVRREPVQVRVIARGHEPAAPAVAAWTRGAVRIDAHERRGQVHGERGLAARSRPDEQDGMRNGATHHGRDGGQRCWLAARHRVLHRQRARGHGLTVDVRRVVTRRSARRSIPWAPHPRPASCEPERGALALP